MKTLSALRTEKRLVAPGKWETGKIHRSAFPLGKGTGPYKLGRAWHWCVHRVADESAEYRVLVAYDPGKLQYWAWLAMIDDDDQALLARVEFHASHDGWHCHWKTGLVSDVTRGVVRAGGTRERRHQCAGDARNVSRVDAFSIAYQLFNVTTKAAEALL